MLTIVVVISEAAQFILVSPIIITPIPHPRSLPPPRPRLDQPGGSGQEDIVISVRSCLSDRFINRIKRAVGEMSFIIISTVVLVQGIMYKMVVERQRNICFRNSHLGKNVYGLSPATQ